ncbi:adenylate/guanylate cyclase domain-containing protein [Thalassospira marina]|uniref:Adenylate/guanylate cyclase domain-containing protein n=1 Tax=Thalassospira marina TaxID=2048283 RepID=A0A2N3KB11_9PROT|nr:adenylate/guanylate cyclase domain-containing protein [Thalassospira marina]PKR47749.1 adenylate/guanylate cyclase domain-containing protein [Thalassospira marina]
MNQVITRKQISYEIYIKDRSGKWIIHAHYTGAQKQTAEEETQQLEREAHVMAVKLIREVYNSETNSADEYVVYQTRDAESREKMAAARAANAIENVAEAQESESKAQPAPKQGKSKKRKKKDVGLIGLALKMMLAFCGAIAIGLAVMLGTARLLEYLPGMGYHISQGVFEKANFFAFVLGFIVSITPMMMALTRNFRHKGKKRKDDDEVAESPAAPAMPSGPSEEQMRLARAEALRRSLEENRSALSEEPISTREDPKDDPDDDAPLPKEPLVKTPALQATRQIMRDFMAGSVVAIRETLPSLDAYHKFGVNLYVAGACDACSDKNALPREQGRDILKDCVSALGANGKMSDTFCNSLEQYLLEPKYSDMYGAGRDSMLSYMKDEKSLSVSVARALNIWSEKPAADPKQAGKKLHALMFTDIVNSTQLTQELGDIGAQQMVHAHNRIVRTALINNYGKEVKHMGDGIMAVFPSSNSAVEGALEIQRQMAQHNARGEMEFHVRIGINAGEAITEENDLFGAVVQLAARVCAAASGDEILVSPTVKETYAGKRAKFKSLGTRQMKGFSAPVEIFAAISRK